MTIEGVDALAICARDLEVAATSKGLSRDRRPVWWCFAPCPQTRMNKKRKLPIAPPPDPAVAAELRYEPNRKHKEPWQPGRKGSLCPPPAELSLLVAARMLKDSVLDGTKRYSHHLGKAFAAQEHLAGCWHGYPVGWVEVPPSIRQNWLSNKVIQKQDLKRNWITSNWS